ncbi:PA2169 family four-helix-bundle protein [uncultured Proteiniphilum sp.]|uniref:ferritin-like domain-containing protein n=1 Tax=uncultured Proteiniphilum sp. TaxID=497637 RepID=UPI0026066FB5|nr:PA2169 family four-helix-bundle protein [uncultured Proteiniphilum sp.]
MNLEKQAETLNDLVLINNDRMEGYQKAIDELRDEDADLRSLFQERIDQSRQFRDELVSEVVRSGERVAEGTKAAGKIYRAWMDVKAFFSGSDRKTILDNCENGEDAALRAYEETLECENLTPEQRSIVIRQQAEIKTSHDTIRAMRDTL